MISETCSCGSSFEADRDDELKLLREWRRSHKCRPKDQYAGSVTGSLEIATGETPSMTPIGFLPDTEPDERLKK